MMTGTAIAISDADEAEALSEYLTSPDRQHPAVVVTRRLQAPVRREEPRLESA